MPRRRKWEHFLAALTGELERPQAAAWSDLLLRPMVLPEVDLEEVRMDTVFLGYGLRYPVLVAALTGGHPGLEVINRRLAALTHRFGLAMSVGSQRVQLVEPEVGASFRTVRRAAPHSLIMANIGAPQLVEQESGPRVDAADLGQLARSIDADALFVHCNFLHEALQRHGDTRAHGVLDALASLIAEFPLPVLVKETGSGLSGAAARQLEMVGVAALDIGGAGGASMARLEKILARWRKDTRTEALASAFVDWGIPSPISLLEVKQATSLPVIASGGIRTGLDALKALALGADVVSVGLPLLQAAAHSQQCLGRWMVDFLHQLRTGMFLVGAASLSQLREMSPVLISGGTQAYLDALQRQHQAVRPLPED